MFLLRKAVRHGHSESVTGNHIFVRIFHKRSKIAKNIRTFAKNIQPKELWQQKTKIRTMSEKTKTITINKAIMMEEIRTLINEGKTVNITVKGNSMNPFMVHLRDQMTLGPWKEEDLRKGTVALVRDTRGNHLIHRIIKVDGNTVTLLGDGNVVQTETATKDNVIGIMYSITRKGRIYTPRTLSWKIYSAIWMALQPVRRWPLGLWRRIFPQPDMRQYN